MSKHKRNTKTENQFLDSEQDATMSISLGKPEIAIIEAIDYLENTIADRTVSKEFKESLGLEEKLAERKERFITIIRELLVTIRQDKIHISEDISPTEQMQDLQKQTPIDSITPLQVELKRIQEEANQKSQSTLASVKEIGRLYLLSKADKTLSSVVSDKIKSLCGISTNEEVNFHVRTAKNKKYLGLYWPESLNEKKQGYKSIGRLEVLLYQLQKDKTLIPRISGELKEIYSENIPPNATASFSVKIVEGKQHLMVDWCAENISGCIDVGEIEKLLKDSTPAQEQGWADKPEIALSNKTKIQR